jgi:hypothetical protein
MFWLRLEQQRTMEGKETWPVMPGKVGGGGAA